MDDHSRGFGWIAGLSAIIVALEPGYLSDGRVVFGPGGVDSHRRTGPIGAESARFDNRHFDTKRHDFSGEHFRETFDTPLGRLVGAEAGRSPPPTNGRDLNDMA